MVPALEYQHLLAAQHEIAAMQVNRARPAPRRAPEQQPRYPDIDALPGIELHHPGTAPLYPVIEPDAGDLDSIPPIQ
jgi:hypothetical protein